ncbi:preprotein translocase subunit SecE [Lusitaniella coriacea LEGE 07157]|uniref:Protein translocase subunit SecE n=1 Tax=Lusitaniella coriacea LEGE 07157 TaxID=945747 RepID=A0A8J7B6Z5_9CYAN|nr:preprotein translocase subunit SecE [Lusitaniella coriacea]MBE9114766.1 preprotein translocase subunit SecE [Lusitaniella coriacea LEGE 07157]
MAKKDAQKKEGSKPKTANKSSADVQAPQEGFNLVKFFTETKEELAKVVWPSRQQLISESIAVMSMVTLVATTIYFVDNLFSWLAGKVFG